MSNNDLIRSSQVNPLPIGPGGNNEIKQKLNVGGSFKDDSIIIQGDYRDKIMTILKEKGFKVKRVGG